MGLIGTIFGLPLAPARGVIALSELIKRRVDEEQADPAVVRRELEAAEDARDRGEISAAEEAQRQQEALNRLQAPRPGTETEQEER
ncbi:MAG TPA: gas vesicle protein GvpG [Amycolatopsis sp.]|nr:gas vesicle protein GvpG [Amycolatopsis sp.]